MTARAAELPSDLLPYIEQVEAELGCDISRTAVISMVQKIDQVSRKDLDFESLLDYGVSLEGPHEEPERQGYKRVLGHVYSWRRTERRRQQPPVSAYEQDT